MPSAGDDVLRPSRRISVLVSGAGVAGCVLAYWFGRLGMDVTVVERAPRLRTGGHALDLFGPAVDVVARMGLLERVRAARTRTELLTVVRPGGRLVDVPTAALAEGVSDRHIEIMRGDLVGLLHEAGRDRATYHFGDSVVGMTQDATGVDVMFASGRCAHHDVVVGADGLASQTRALTFGDVPRTFLGGHLAVFTLPDYLRLTGRAVAFHEVNRAVGVYPAGHGTAKALFLFRSDRELVRDTDDLPTRRSVVRRVYEEMPWAELPRLLAEMERADDLYVDAISQIHMSSWSRGRFTLAGDAGYGPGPAVGGGTSLAVVGAYLLAAELARSKGDPVAAFPRYEAAMAEAVRHSRDVGPAVMAMLVPHSRLHVWAMGEGLRWLARLPSPLRRRLTAYGGGPAAMLNSIALPDPA